MTDSHGETNKGQRGRLRTARGREILRILHAHALAKGLTPEKLRQIIEDLGPTYIKLGQILSMRRDMLPKEYCEELVKLRSAAKPMPFDTVRAVIEASCGEALEALFPFFEQAPIGSASIAQAHLAMLADGRKVVVKVQRPGIHEIMAEDIAIMRRVTGLLRYTGAADVVDFNMVLDELWKVAQEEMDFLIEARNLLDFARFNRDEAGISFPALYEDMSNARVLVMEYIDGCAINDLPACAAQGYDMDQIGARLAENYIKQVVEDGFFHADPHPGNLKLREGTIVWIDMGMMGRLPERDQRLIAEAVYGVARRDVREVARVVIAMGDHRGAVDHMQFRADLEDLLARYGDVDLGEMDMGKAMMSLMELAQKHRIRMPAGVSMLGRGVVTLEGVLAEISPQTNLIEITARRIVKRFQTRTDWAEALRAGGRSIHDSGRKALDIPALISDALRMALKGESYAQLRLDASEKYALLLTRIGARLGRMLFAGALVVGGSILALSGAQMPRLGGLPVWSLLLYACAALLWLTRKR